MPIFESPFGRRLNSEHPTMGHLRDLHNAMQKFYTEYEFGRFPDVDTWLYGTLVALLTSMKAVARERKLTDMVALSDETPLTTNAARVYQLMARQAASREGVAYWREYFAKLGFGNPR